MIDGPLPAAAALVLLLFSHWLLGRLLFRSVTAPADGLARFMAALGLGLGISGPLALLLAAAGVYSVGRWLGLLALLAVIAWWRGRSFPQLPAGSALPSARGPGGVPWHHIWIILWLPAAVWLYFRPHEYILGGADAGVYVNLGAQIATEGGIWRQEPLLAELDPDLRPGLLRRLDDGNGAPYYLFPAFYVTDPDAGQVVPRFYFLHPAWLAGATALGGVDAALLMTGFWATLAGVVICLVLWEMGGGAGGGGGGGGEGTTRGGVVLLGLTGMTLNALQQWFARYPVTEALTQFWVWFGLWCLLRWLRPGRSEKVWGLLAALAWGNVFLARIDMYPWLVVPAGLAGWQVLSGAWSRSRLWFYVPLTGVALFSLLLGYGLSPVYWRDLFGYAGLLLRLYWFASVAVSAIGLAVVLVLWRRRHHWPQVAASLVAARWLRLGAATVVLLLVLYAWFVRPVLSAGAGYVDPYSGLAIPDLDGENLRRLGWYLTPLGLALAAAGTMRLIWRLDQRRFVLLATGLLFAGLYLWRIQANPHQVYAMRRYVPVVLPFAVSAAALLLGELGSGRSRWRPAAAVVLALLWLGGTGWAARGFVSQVNHQGLSAQFNDAQAAFTPGSLILFNDQSLIGDGDLLGTPLHYLFGHDVLTIRDPGLLTDPALPAAIDQWQSDGRMVYWVGDLPPLLAGRAGTTALFELNTSVLESPYDRKPTRVLSFSRSLPITQLSAP